MDDYSSYIWAIILIITVLSSLTKAKQKKRTDKTTTRSPQRDGQSGPNGSELPTVEELLHRAQETLTNMQETESPSRPVTGRSARNTPQVAPVYTQSRKKAHKYVAEYANTGKIQVEDARQSVSTGNKVRNSASEAMNAATDNRTETNGGNGSEFAEKFNLADAVIYSEIMHPKFED